MLQELLIRIILKPIALILSGINDKNRERIFVLSGVLGFGLYFLNMSQKISLPYLVYFAMGCFFMGIMIVIFLKDNIKPVKFDKKLLVCWTAVGIFMLIASIRFNIDWISEAMIFLVACPVAFVTWGNVDQKYFLSLISRICEYSFVIYFVSSCLFFPVSSQQYSGLFVNENGAAQYLVLVFACLFVKLLEIKKGAGRILDYILLGFSSALILYTNSRTGQLSQIVVILFVGMTFLYSNRDKLKEKIFKVLIPVAFVMLLAIPTTIEVLKFGNSCGSRIVAFVEQKTEVNNSEQSQESDTVGQGGEALEQEPAGEVTDNEEVQGAEGFLDYNQQKTDIAGKDVDAISTGRVSIWKEYIKKVKLFGNGEEEKFWIESRQAYYTTAHMTPLTVAFRFGAVCAAVYVLCLVLSGLKAIQYGGSSKEAYRLLPLAITMAFGVTSMLASINTPFSYMITMYYYYIQTVLISKSEKVE